MKYFRKAVSILASDYWRLLDLWIINALLFTIDFYSKFILMSDPTIVAAWIAAFAALFGAILGASIAAITTTIQGKAEDRRSQERIKSEETRLQIQLDNDRVKTVSEIKRAVYGEVLTILNRSLVAVLEQKIYPASVGNEETQRYHAAINAFRLIAGEKLESLTDDYFRLYPDGIISVATVRMEKAKELKKIIEEMRSIMKSELGF